jgi:FkbH-like protein
VYRSFLEVVEHQESRLSDELAFRYLESGDVDGPTSELSFRQLGGRTRAVAAWLQDHGLANKRALLLYPPGLDFITGFFGCLAADVVAVPAPLPQLNALDRALRRLRRIVADADIAVVLATRPVVDGLAGVIGGIPELATLRWIATEEIPDAAASAWRAPDVGPDTIAFLQYTSGSTSAPRGVQVSHGNLLHNQRAAAETMGHSGEVVEAWNRQMFVSWLPMYHDMGLIGPILQNVYLGSVALLMSPLDFVQKPERWLTAVSEFRPHTTGGPNFGYELCARRATPELVERLDLSSWRVAFNGAEPVRAATLRRFAEVFEPTGFRFESFQPVYGLAEATLLVTGAAIDRAPTVLESAAPGSPPVGVGTPPSGVDIVIADPDRLTACGDGAVGEIWVAGESVTRGYLGDEERTRETFHARLAGGDRDFLRTGDLGFIQDGELFVTGRRKDLLVIDGRNHYPQDLELAAETAHGGVRPGYVAAFSVQDEATRGERAVIVAEVRMEDPAELDAVESAIRAAISAEHGVAVKEVVLIRPRTIFKTSSGKIQRGACREGYLAGELEAVDRRGRAEADPQAGPASPINRVQVDAPAVPSSQTASGSVRACLIDAIARRAGLDPARVDVERPLAEFGLGSRELVELVTELSERTGRRLDPSLVFEYPTIAAVAAAIEPVSAVAAGHDAAAGQDTEGAIAIVSMACRYPGGADDPQALWDLLVEARDVVSDVPPGRWNIEGLVDPDPDAVGKAYSLRGGYLADIDRFDAAFFGIGPREATAMDPQQRLLLHVAWEAIERADIDPQRLAGSATGVYLGVYGSGYLAGADVHQLNGHVATGTANSVASGRISYLLGLHGPAVTIDTACSSSLVALHLASQALRGGECDMALAGGVTLMVTPNAHVEFSRQRALSASGRCQPFAEGADGMVWAEGCGVVVLKRLEDAERDGDQVLAVIRGSATNQDGRSQGLTAPSGIAQERVIRAALGAAGLEPDDIDYVEGHGTGTTLGDPIELRALARVFGPGRSARRPLGVGSLKSNLGHTQAGAGIGGVIKTVLALQNELLPRSLNADEPTGRIEWAGSGISVQNSAREWARGGDRVRRAGVSSFGISGTNAHVVLEEPPSPRSGPEGTATGTNAHVILEEPPAVRRHGSGTSPDLGPERAARLFPLSARSDASLRGQAERLRHALEADPSTSLPALARSLAVHRSHLERRAVVVADSAPELLDGLRRIAAGQQAPGLVVGASDAALTSGKLAFVLPGQGAQWIGMARDLMSRSEVFRAELERCDAALRARTDWSVADLLRDESLDESAFRSDAVIQPTLFAVAVSLAAVWRASGVQPQAVVGHSQGEIAAAAISGALSLSDAAAVIVRRSRAVTAAGGKGQMAVVGLPFAVVESRLATTGGRVSVAAVNGPTTTVVSGDREPLAALLAGLERDRVYVKRVDVDFAGHSSHVDALREPLLADLTGITAHPTDVPWYSTVLAEPMPRQPVGADYWYRNLRETVRFAQTVERMIDDGFRYFVELSPHPALTTAIHSVAESMRRDVVAVGSLRRAEDGPRCLDLAMAELYVGGWSVDWAGLVPERGRVELPTYAWDTRRYWAESALPSVRESGLARADHPLLSFVVPQPDSGGVTVTGRLSPRGQAWLVDHAIADTVLLPGAGLVELACRAAREAGCSTLRELTLREPLIVPDQGIQILVTVGGVDGSGDRPVSVHSRAELDNGAWATHASGAAASSAPSVTSSATDFSGQWPPVGAMPIELDGHYERLAERGYRYGPAFELLHAAWRDGADIVAEVALPASARDEAPSYELHPTLLDAALHAIEFLGMAPDPEHVLLPFSFSGVTVHAVGAAVLRVRLTAIGDRSVRVSLADASGGLVASVESLTLRQLPLARLGSVSGVVARSLHVVDWVESVRPDTAATSSWVDVADFAGTDAAVPRVLSLRGGGDRLDGAGTDAALPGAVHAATAAVLAQVQAWLSDDHLDAKLVVLTSGAAGTGTTDDLEHAPIWGLLRSAQTEHPDRIVLVDVDAANSTDTDVAVAIATAADEPQLALRDGGVLVPRLVRARPESTDRPSSWNADGTVLLTGGTGRIGAQIARHLVTEHGVRHLLIASRQGTAAAGATALAAQLSELGADIRIVACDVADRDALATVIGQVPPEHPLTAVVHAAGSLDDGLFSATTSAQLAATLRPKVDAAWNLHELTRDLDLTAFVVFSSAAGVFGTAGQASYAAANTFLDALCRYRRRHGLPGTSLAWGLWEQDGGLTGHLDDRDHARLRRLGMLGMSAEEGLELFDAALALDEPVVVPARIDPAAMAAAAAGSAVSPILRTVSRAVRRVADAGQVSAPIALRMSGLDGIERERLMLSVVGEHAAAALGHADARAIRAERSFADLGFDSLGAVELRNRLQAATGVRLPATMVFDHPNPAALSRYLLSRITPAEQPTLPQAGISGGSDADPIAIVGVGCRFPGGVHSMDDLWEVVANGREVLTDLPRDRGWDLDGLYDPDPSKTGTTYARAGGFLDDVADFDADFFHISPREALAMDPQQRLLLEVAWEALERACVDPASLRGTSTGVYMGVTYFDYAGRLHGQVPAEFEQYLSESSTGSVASGRVAYALGLQGPAVTIDTACSSSLVGMHLGAQALRTGECSLALVGAATVMASPGLLVSFARKHALAPDGRCKAFAEAADGTGFSEGAGVFVLERLSDAVRHGHPVLALVAGSAVNHDGASNGLTAPNGPAQQRVIQQALANAGLSAADVDLVEAHGTGTTLGDPIEAQALLATYGQQREAPLWLGSVKSNLGHLQSAAGAAGVIKVIAAMGAELMPATLHVDEPSSHVDWSAGSVRLLTEPRKWPLNGHRRRAGVSSFGISGTNAHLILEEAPARTRPAAAAEPALPAAPVPLVLSATTAAALSAHAARLVARLERRPELDTADVARTLATRRSTFAERAVVFGTDRARLLDGLRALAEGVPDVHVVRGKADAAHTVGAADRPVFVFPGHGSQWSGMALELLDTEPVFAQGLLDCASALGEFVDWSLVDVLRGAPDAPEIDRLDVVQPVLFAVLVALLRLWESVGVRPAAVIGHSQGEIVAAYAAGALSLRDAARLAALRGIALAELSGTGAMAALSLPKAQVDNLLTWFDQLEIGGVNSPNSTVVSGPTAAIEELLSHCEAEGIRARRVAIRFGSHSRNVDAAGDRLAEAFAGSGSAPSSSNIEFFSTVLGAAMDTAALDETYWFRNVREPVQFEQAVRAAFERGHRTFVEVSPHPVLTAAMLETIEGSGSAAEAFVGGSVRRDDAGGSRFLRSVAELWVAGGPAEWTRYVGGRGEGARFVELPTYPFQRVRYWLDAEPVADARQLGLVAADHPFLGAVVPQPDSGGLYVTGRVSTDVHPWLRDHVVADTVLMPATGLLDIAIRAGDEVHAALVRELVLQAPMVLPATGGIQLQVCVGAPAESGDREISIYSRSERGVDAPWLLHAEGMLGPESLESASSFDAAQWPPVDATAIDVGGLYQRLAERGYRYGHAFRAVQAAWRLGEDFFAEVALPDDAHRDAQKYALHPALFDATLHATALAAGDDDRTLVPFVWNGVKVSASGATSLRVRISRIGADAVALDAVDPAGTPVLRVDSVLVRPVTAELLASALATTDREDLYRLEWRRVPDPAPVAAAGGNEVVVYRPEPGRTAQAVHQATRSMLAALRSLQDGKALLVQTSGAIALPGEDVLDLAGAAVWGMVRSAQAEDPGRIVLVDSDGDVDPDVVLGHREPQLVIRAGITHVGRLAPLRAAESSDTATRPLDDGRPVLVTGAPGALGSLVARHLVVEHGVKRLILASRRGMAAPGAAELQGELTGLGADVVIAACDVTDRNALSELLRDVSLSGVVHCAGVLDDATIGTSTPERLGAVLGPKVDAALHLHELTASMDLSLFALFSSIAGTLGSPGQSSYAAANAFLDALAAHRAANGLVAHSLAWGWWDAGMASAAGDRARMTRSGLRPLPPGDGLALFDAAVAGVEPNPVPVRFDRDALRALPSTLKVFAELVRGRTRRVAAAGAQPEPGGFSLAALLANNGPAEDVSKAAYEIVTTQTARVLGQPAAQLDATRSFQSLGFDSLMAVELRNALRASTGVTVTVGAVFDNPTPRALAEYLVRVAGGESGPAPVAVSDGIVPEVVALPVTRDVIRLLRSASPGMPGAAHTIGLAIRLGTTTTRSTLEDILNQLAARHAALRTAITANVEQGRQLEVRRTLTNPLLRWSEVDECADGVVAQHLQALMEPAFDLETAPLWRFELLASPTGQVLVFGAHHGVSDAQSMLLVAGEIDAALSGSWPATPPSNRDIENLLRAQQVEPVADDADRAAWRGEFVGSRRLDLELSGPRPTQRSYRAGTLAVPLPADLLGRAADRARRLEITPAAFFLGVLTILLSRRQERDRFVLAVPVDTRIHVDALDAVGYFGVPVPYPARIEDGDLVGDVLRRAGERLRHLLTRGVGFSDTLATLVAEGLHREDAPLVEVYFNFLRSAAALQRVTPVPAGVGYSDLDLMVTVMADLGQIVMTYNLDIIDGQACAELGAEFVELLAAVADDADLPVRTASAETAPTNAQTTAQSTTPTVAFAATFALGKLPHLFASATGEASIVEAPYHHVLAALRDPSGVLSQPSTSVGLILLRAADLERFGPITDEDLAELGREYPAAVRALSERTRTPLVVGFVPSADADPRFARWEAQVGDELRELPGVAVVPASEWTRYHDVGTVFDAATESLAHLPFSTEYQAAIALTLTEIAHAALTPPPKVIVVDGDETLWSGVAAEVGPEHVDLGGPRARLARTLLGYRAAGVLLVLVSNNDDETVRAVLDRPDSVLGAEHFSVLSTGWRPKAERIHDAARQLRLGLDSFVFLDDNPVEVAGVRAVLPEVLSVTCPAVDELESFLLRLWPVVPAAATAEDAQRAEFYAQERDRDDARARLDFADFLEQLRLDVEVAEVTDATAERAAQLLRRTNQFALRKVDDGAIDAWRRVGEVWTVSARDRFGDYGRIGVLAVRVVGDTLEVLGWHLSCRALGRGVEERLLGWLADRATALGCSAVRLTAERTARNVPARRLIAALGGSGDIDDARLDVVAAPRELRSFRSWEQVGGDRHGSSELGRGA